MTDLYATARQMLADLNAKRVSARELLGAHVARNAALAASINAVVATDPERARKDALAIDEARASVPAPPTARSPRATCGARCTACR